MLRNPANTNQKLHIAETYRSFPVMHEKGPMIENYLETLYRVLQASFSDYSRVFAFRVDLRYPEEMPMMSDHTSNTMMSRFIDSFKAKIKHNRERAKERNPYSHDTVVRFIWAREVGQKGQVHYHAAFILNGDAFCALGSFGLGRDNMYNRLQEAWASALRLPVEIASGLVHIPHNAMYRLSRGNLQGIAAFFHRASYLCKADTKSFGNGHHGFGASRG